MKVYVEGKLKTRSWEKDGQIRRKTEVIAENIQILYRPDIYRNQNVEEANDEAAQAPESQEEQGGFFSNIF